MTDRCSPIAHSTVQLGVVASTTAAAAAYTLHRFAGVGERPIVLTTLVLASWLGWTQPAMRTGARDSMRR